VQLNSCSVPKTVCELIAWNWHNLNALIDTCHARKRLFKNVGFELSLVFESKVTKLRSSGTKAIRLFPNVGNSFWRRRENLDCFSATEGAAFILKDLGSHSFSRGGVRNKDHATFMSCDEDSTVGNLLDLELNLAV
jgi:hypothetical protein